MSLYIPVIIMYPPIPQTPPPPGSASVSWWDFSNNARCCARQLAQASSWSHTSPRMDGVKQLTWVIFKKTNASQVYGSFWKLYNHSTFAHLFQVGTYPLNLVKLWTPNSDTKQSLDSHAMHGHGAPSRRLQGRLLHLRGCLIHPAEAGILITPKKQTVNFPDSTSQKLSFTMQFTIWIHLGSCHLTSFRINPANTFLGRLHDCKPNMKIEIARLQQEMHISLYTLKRNPSPWVGLHEDQW